MPLCHFMKFLTSGLDFSALDQEGIPMRYPENIRPPKREFYTDKKSLPSCASV